MGLLFCFVFLYFCIFFKAFFCFVCITVCLIGCLSVCVFCLSISLPAHLVPCLLHAIVSPRRVGGCCTTSRGGERPHRSRPVRRHVVDNAGPASTREPPGRYSYRLHRHCPQPHSDPLVRDAKQSQTAPTRSCFTSAQAKPSRLNPLVLFEYR